jgi:hypothetical protein
MQLDYLPLLAIQRDLYRMPRGMERFHAYLRTMVDPETGDLALPLVAMNPMGKDHLPLCLDRLLAIDADGVAARATAETAGSLAPEPGRYTVSLVLADDAGGGWTNRTTSEYTNRFEQQAYYARGFVAVTLWTSETYDAERVREETRLALFRAAWVGRHGAARALGEMLAQEGWAMSRAGTSGPALDREDVEYTREILAPYRERRDRPTLVAALFGDEAARQLGYAPLGLTARAGFALALDEARRDTPA